MGRTNATYRNHLDNFIDKFKPFRKGLRQENKQHLESLWEKAHSHAQAAAYMNSANPGMPAIISILLGIQKETQEHKEEIENLEQRIEELES
ncbi:MAG: hypothetical protein BRC29_03060 [Nanohaloarchaea archaeon SW_7_43_1]|nr:MAG: hypothetical protein BRC29_03060 [Nanohaloarchaea archaeon SW_7_43_1]